MATYNINKNGISQEDLVNFITELSTLVGGSSTGGTITVPESIAIGSETTQLNFSGSTTTAINLASSTCTTGISITAGSMTDGIKISATTPVDGIEISSACSANAINLSGASATSIRIGKAAITAIRIGDWVGSAALGSAVPFVTGQNVYSDGQLDVVAVFGESTVDLTSAYSAKCGRFRHVINGITCNHESYGLIGQVVAKNVSFGHYHSGLMGTFEVNTALTVLTSYGCSAVAGRIGGAGITVDSGGLLAGVLSVCNSTSWTANNGTISAFATKKTAGSTTWPVGLYMASGDVTKGIDITCSAIGATGRIAKLFGSCADGAMTDGYGAVEIELTMSGTATNTCAASSTWINMAASSSGGSNLICVQNNGIWVPSTGTPMASATAIIGMRMQYVTEGGENPGALYLFSTNINDNALTAMFHVNAAVDVAWTTGAATTNVGKIPLFRDVSAGKTWYVNVYDG